MKKFFLRIFHGFLILGLGLTIGASVTAVLFSLWFILEVVGLWALLAIPIVGLLWLIGLIEEKVHGRG